MLHGNWCKQVDTLEASKQTTSPTTPTYDSLYLEHKGNGHKHGVGREGRGQCAA